MGKYVIIIIGLVIFATSCGEERVYTPKPRLYPRIDFPDKGTQSFISDNCPFTFDFPSYANVSRDINVFKDEEPNACWFNLQMPKLNGSLYCSYIDIEDEKEFNKVIRDAFKIVAEHNSKANYRDEGLIRNKQDVTGLMFDISGPVATPFQFYLTDTTNHFFRASLYFNSKVDPDSMAPIHDFVIEDMKSMINSFSWK